jgi:hypothetical protein
MPPGYFVLWDPRLYPEGFITVRSVYRSYRLDRYGSATIVLDVDSLGRGLARYSHGERGQTRLGGLWRNPLLRHRTSSYRQHQRCHQGRCLAEDCPRASLPPTGVCFSENPTIRGCAFLPSTGWELAIV